MLEISIFTKIEPYLLPLFHRVLTIESALDNELPPLDHRDREDLSLVLIEFSASLIAI